MTTDTVSDVMTIKQAGKRYGALTEAAIRRGVKSGAIRSVRVGAKYLITPAAIDEFLNGNTQEKGNGKVSL